MIESTIIAGCQENKPQCQKALVDKYAPLLFTVCRRYMYDNSMAEDALQETFINIFKYIGKYQPNGSFEAWMKKIAVNCSLQFIQRSGAVRKQEVGGTNYELPENPDVYSKLNAEQLLAMVRALPLGFRTVFNLYAIDGYSHKEISQLTGITESASRSQLSRARALLAKQINKMEAIPTTR